MREEKPKSPSQKNKNAKAKNWFWPIVYSGIAIVFVGMIWGYNAILKDKTPDLADVVDVPNDPPIVETNAPKETLKYPLQESLVNDAVILQEYYDESASESMRESALLVFNQQYVMNTGVSISVKDQPFEVIASLSGFVEDVVVDPFKGGEIVLSHADGFKTVYRSVTGILVKEGDEIIQGQPIATSSENEWNPSPGIHLHFEIQKDGVALNPRSYLGF